MSIMDDAAHYWHILRLPADGWGMHCCPKTGQASHWYLLSMQRKYGSELFDIALDKTHPYKKKEVANEHP